jgi:hypothetical protein
LIFREGTFGKQNSITGIRFSGGDVGSLWSGRSGRDGNGRSRFPHLHLSITNSHPNTIRYSNNDTYRNTNANPIRHSHSTPTIPTLTPLPTFAPEELETAVADLLANPMNCDVPCWWGAIPNDTTFFEIYQFLELHQLTDYISVTS